MDKNKVTRIIKAVSALLAVAGVTVSPENQETILQGFLAVYAIASSVQALWKKK